MSDASQKLARYVNLSVIGSRLGVARSPDEDDDAFASRCHHVVDALMREHALLRGDRKFLKLMAVHDAIEACFSSTH